MLSARGRLHRRRLWPSAGTSSRQAAINRDWRGVGDLTLCPLPSPPSSQYSPRDAQTMHFSPAHARRRQNAREGPVEGRGEAAWGLPPPNWWIPEHSTKAQHHQHGRPCPNDGEQHDRSPHHPRPRRPNANGDRTSARRPGGRRRGESIPNHNTRHRGTTSGNKEHTTNSAGTHRGATSDKHLRQIMQAQK